MVKTMRALFCWQQPAQAVPQMLHCLPARYFGAKVQQVEVHSNEAAQKLNCWYFGWETVLRSFTENGRLTCFKVNLLPIGWQKEQTAVFQTKHFIKHSSGCI